jgi:hypothetical protein
MLTGLLLALASVQAPAPTAGHGPAAPQAGGAHSCAIQGGEVVPTMQVAREIAEAIIRNRESAAEIAMMELSVQPVGDDAWDVVQTIPDRKEPDGSVTHTDGGGLAIRIDRCNGAILFVNYLI